MGEPSRRAAAYAVLLILQSVVASFLFWMAFPIFLSLATHPGEPKDLPRWTEIAIAGGAVILQCCYWIRYRWVAMYVPFRSAVVGHFLLFASRASFFFGGALFSAIFFRHVPELDVLPPLGQALGKALAILAILFSLYCYSLELERLGKAVEGHPTT